MSGGILKKLNIVLGADTTDLETKMQKAAAKLRKEGRNFSQIGSELSLAVSVPLLGIGASAIKAAGDMESFRMGFNTTMKAAGRSAEDATKELEALREVAKMPGIDFEGAIKGSMRLQGVGMNAERARKIIAELANGISMAGGTAQDLDGVTRQLAQMAGKGTVMQQDLNIMLENMPMLAKVLKDTFGATTADGLRDMGVNADKFITGITEGLSKLERVPGGLQNAMVNFGVEVKMALGTVGEAINKAFNVTGKLESFATWIGTTAASFASLSEGTQKAIITTLGVTAAIGPAIKAYSIWNNTKAAAIDLANKAVGAYSSLKGAVLAATEKFMAMDKVTKATTIGLVVAAIGLAVVAFEHFNSELSTAEKNTKNLADVQLTAQQSIAAERMEAERMIAVLKNENASRKDKEAALKRLNELGGEYFKGLSIEKKDVGELTKAYDAYVANLLKAATIKASEGKLLDLEKTRLEILQSITDNEKQAALNKGKAMSGAFGAAPRLLELKKELADIEAQQKALADIAYKSAPVASGGTGGGTSTFTPGGDGGKKKGSKKKDEVDAMTELAKAMSLADAKAAALGSTFDATQAKTDAIRDAIETLLGQGILPSDERVAMLSERYKNLTADLEPLNTALTTVSGTMTLGVTLQDVAITKAEEVSQAYRAMADVIGEATAAAGSSMTDMAAQGETSFKRLGRAALKSAADVVRAALMKAVATQIEKLLATVPPPFNIAIAAAGGAAVGLLFNKALGALKVPALAEGAVVTKPTLALIGEAGPEMVLPPKKLPGVAAMAGLTKNNGGGNMHLTGEFRVQGTDLVLVLEKAQQQQYRSFGRG